MVKSCSKCKKNYEISNFYSNTEGKYTELCRKCRSCSYKISKKIFEREFIVSKKETCVLINDLINIIFSFSDNNTKFNLCVIYGNIFDLKCRNCKNKAKYCTISTNYIKCMYCIRMLHEKFGMFYCCCETCIDNDDALIGIYMEDKDECICNGRRQMYDIFLKTVEI
jgi:hypothetical protein